MSKLLSVIVPVYNVEAYLDKCLSSLIDKELDYEVIVVNDGTKDNSQQIIDKYVNDYPAIFKSLIKENGGLSDARNFGLPFATGKYLMFIDSDDYINPGYLSKIVKYAEDNRFDLVVSDIKYVYENGDNTMYKSGLSDFSKNKKRALFSSPLFAWNKLYLREKFFSLNLVYPKGLWYEDIPVSLKYFANADNIGHFTEVGVNYLQRSTSILGSGYDERMFHIFNIFDLVIKEFKEDLKYEEFYEELEYLAIEQLLLWGAFRFLRTKEYKKLMTKSFGYMKNNFPTYKNNKYIEKLSFKNRVFIKTNNKITMHLWHKYLDR